MIYHEECCLPLRTYILLLFDGIFCICLLDSFDQVVHYSLFKFKSIISLLIFHLHDLASVDHLNSLSPEVGCEGTNWVGVHWHHLHADLPAEFSTGKDRGDTQQTRLPASHGYLQWQWQLGLLGSSSSSFLCVGGCSS